MGIYVKGMKMPNSCGDCLMKVQYVSGITWCEPMVKILATDYKPVCCYGRPDFCPLVEIPEPHGDLIDRNALNIGEYEREDADTGTIKISLGGLLDLFHKVKDAPPVIEAEGEP